jgi:hypothetical protein
MKFAPSRTELLGLLLLLAALVALAFVRASSALP